MPDKLLKDMSPEELYTEITYWTEKIVNATQWGASLAAAYGCLKAAERELQRRKENDTTNTK